MVAITAAVVARVPQVRPFVERSVDEAMASGDLLHTPQRDLAVGIAVATALLVTVLTVFLTLVVARWLHRHFGLPELSIGRARVPAALVVVAGILLTKHVAALVAGSTTPRTDPWVWGPAVVVYLSAMALVVRQLGHRRQNRPVVLLAALGLLSLVV